MSIFLHFVHRRYANSEVLGLKMDRNGQMERSISIGPVQPRKEVHLEMWTAFSKLFRLDLTDPFSFRPKFPEILVEWIAPKIHCSPRDQSLSVFYQPSIVT